MNETENTYNSVFKHVPTGLIFNNRKEAKRVMGPRRYRNAVRLKQLIFCYECGEGESPITTSIK